MIEHVFPPEMMKEREKQLALALLHCAGVYYDVNFTRDRILGKPIQIVNGKEYDILAQIGKPKNCTYSEIIDYWYSIMPPEERDRYVAFSRIDHVLSCYARGERVLTHTFWTKDVMGNPMLAEQTVRLYEDCTSGDVLGLIYVSNGSEREYLRQREALLSQQSQQFSTRTAMWESLASSIPGGYHRCSTENGFELEFASNSFLDIVGWTREELRDELDNKIINIVAPEDRDFFMQHEPALQRDGRIDLAYRIIRKDGTRRWVQDATVRARMDGQDVYQCTLADITDFVHRHEELTRQHLALTQKETLMETMEQNMPGGYHRCKPEQGLPFIYIGKHFTDLIGYTKEELQTEFDNLFTNLVHPDDTPAMDTFYDMMRRREKDNAYRTSVYRLRHKDGTYRWVTDSTMFVDLGEDSFFQGTISDVTRYIDDLNEARKRAEASSHAKSVFLFNASHDIRTPMNAIQGFAHIIQENADNPAIVRETIQKVTQAGNTLMTLMNDVLELARIEQGKEEISPEAIYLHEHGKHLYEMFAGEMESAGIEFRIAVNVQHPHVRCDSLKLSRIGMNLLSNARKFTPAGGTVTFGVDEIRCDGDTATYRYYVKDTGIGMSQEFLTRAFGQFERERTSTASGISGSGLGLAIIKKLVELMGGEVSIQSELGQGTEIASLLTFPLISQEETHAAQETAAPPDMTGKRVLLVEDNEFNREIARYILEAMNFAVEEAENGAIAVEKLLHGGAGYYDLVLMDIQMPIMDGYAATREIRSFHDEGLACIPILAMTANAFEEDRQQCLSVGMDGHIAKPIDQEAFLQELHKVLG